ncbi:hypothetical protein ACF06P_13160 [Streptomyces sp. NPDC015684]
MGESLRKVVGLIPAIPLAAPYSLAFLALVMREDVRWRAVRIDACWADPR